MAQERDNSIALSPTFTDEVKKEVCPDCGAEITYTEGCKICFSCGWSPCQ